MKQSERNISLCILAFTLENLSRLCFSDDWCADRRNRYEEIGKEKQSRKRATNIENKYGEQKYKEKSSITCTRYHLLWQTSYTVFVYLGHSVLFFQFFIVKRFFSYKKRPINPYLSNRTAAFCVSKKHKLYLLPTQKNFLRIPFQKTKHITFFAS